MRRRTWHPGSSCGPPGLSCSRRSCSSAPPKKATGRITGPSEQSLRLRRHRVDRDFLLAHVLGGRHARRRDDHGAFLVLDCFLLAVDRALDGGVALQYPGDAVAALDGRVRLARLEDAFGDTDAI